MLRTHALISKVQAQALSTTDDASLTPSSKGHRPPGTEQVVAGMVAEGEMELDVAELEELFRSRPDEQPELRAQRLKAGLKKKHHGVTKRFQKDKH